MSDGLPPQRRGPGSFVRSGARAEKPKDTGKTVARLWKTTSGARKGFGWVLLLSVLASASSIFSPLIIGSAVNSIASGNPIAALIAALAALYVCDWLVRFLQAFFMAAISQKVVLRLREALFGAMKNLPLAFFDLHQHGELMSRLTNDIDSVSTTLSDSLAQLMVYMFTIIGVLAIMLASSPLLTIASAISIVLVYFLTKAVTKRTRLLYSDQQRFLGKLNGQIEESISGINIVKAFRREEDMSAEFEAMNSDYCKAATQAAIISGFLMPLTGVINNIGYLIIAVSAGILCAQGRISVGLISSFLLYSRQFQRPFVDIANIYNNLQSAVAGAERVFGIIDEEPEPIDAPGAIELKKPRGDIEFRNIHFSYDPLSPILKGISLKVPAGTRVAIVGETGAGKTTIINLLTRFYDLGSGSIILDGNDLKSYSRESLRKAFGIVLQDTSLFGDSIRANISYGNRDASLEEIISAAEAAGAHAFITRLSEGYDTVLEQGGNELSQGERQLITIARAVLAQSPILILDEATSSVDTLTEQKIRQAVLMLSSNRTSFMIAHRLSTIRESDMIIVIADGQIAEMGTHDELVSFGGRYSEMYQAQSGE
ncbi:MAG: ABC transporter ATP-binding protein/permease [Eubacteriaceae bacterium]|nr:ABC transporter ATP-binding protein/permease [Eubacteriaceae bacterium]